MTGPNASSASFRSYSNLPQSRELYPGHLPGPPLSPGTVTVLRIIGSFSFSEFTGQTPVFLSAYMCTDSLAYHLKGPWLGSRPLQQPSANRTFHTARSQCSQPQVVCVISKLPPSHPRCTHARFMWLKPISTIFRTLRIDIVWVLYVVCTITFHREE